MRHPARSAVLALASFVVGCGEIDDGQLLVVVDTDLEVGREIEAVNILVAGGFDFVDIEGQREIRLVPPQAEALPFSLGIAPRGRDTSRLVLVSLQSLSPPGGATVETRAITGFVPRETRVLEMFLARRCTAEACPDTMTCGRDGCAPVHIDPTRLPRAGEDGGAGGP